MILDFGERLAQNVNKAETQQETNQALEKLIRFWQHERNVKCGN